MQSFQDPSKKSSITSLLNPDVATAYPHTNSAGASHPSLTARQHPTHLQTVSYAQSNAPYPSGTTFGLRSASWGAANNNGDNHPANGYPSGRIHHSIPLGRKPAVQNEHGRTPYPSQNSGVPHPYSNNSENRLHRPRSTSIQSMTGIESGGPWHSPNQSSTTTPYVSTSPKAHLHPRPAMSNGLQNGHHNSGIMPPHAAVERQNGTIAYTDRRPAHDSTPRPEAQLAIPNSLPPQPPIGLHREHPEGSNGSPKYSALNRDDHPTGYAVPASHLVRNAGPHNSVQPHVQAGPRAAMGGMPDGLQPQSQSSDSASMHSEASELTRLQTKSKRSAGYPNTGTDQPDAAVWQTTERASVRLAARVTVQSSPAPHPSSTAPFYGSASQRSPYLPPVAAPAGSQPHPPQQDPSPAPSTSSKRQLPESEASTPKAKRPAKGKAKVGPDGSPMPSKRGFNAKKRSEAALIAAQNAQDRDEDDLVVDSGSGGPPVSELQFARCMSNRYRNDNFPRCVSCTRRWAGDTCRFQGIRLFIKQNKTVKGVAFNNVKPTDAPTLNFPNKWNVPLTLEHIDRSKKVIANALLPTLRSDFEHLGLDDVIRRARETDVRVTCDTCMTSIFSSSWMCRVCGRESCVECFNLVRELTKDPPNATAAEIQERQKRREMAAHSTPFFLACTKRTEHHADCFSPTSRFFPDELSQAIDGMENLVIDASNSESRLASNPLSPTPDGRLSRPAPSRTDPLPSDTSGTTDWNEVFKSSGVDLDLFPPALKPSNSAGEAHIPPNLSEAAATTPYYKICRYTDGELSGVETSQKFSKIWAYGEPLLVANILSKFKISWTPDYFSSEFGDRECLITECEQDANKKTIVKDFFAAFGKYEGRTEVWKLKDWPPSADFKTAFPIMYQDFSEAVPVPDYVRRDGVYNIGSHFPSNVVAPDLGPKMYNAWAANQKPGSKGSTRLHMDMADALNVMLYAAPCPDGSPGCAIWDVYRAEDSDKIRMFLKKRHNLPPNYDPIHGQQFYLDDALRAALYRDYGVCGYRVYQRPGEAIFIPAGCAHQVSNLADSIKIATDFVSPENIDRCAKLTKEFREQNKHKVWKEDILQLKAMMWFAWQSCCRQERLLRGEVEEEVVQAGRGGGSPGRKGAISETGPGKPRSSGGKSN